MSDAGAEERVRFDTKVVVMIREGLAPWQALNVTAFLTSGVAAASPEIVGEPYEDADGTHYLALIGQPVVIFTGALDDLRRARETAVRRGLATSVYTAEMFGTGHDAANRAAVRAVAGDDLDLVGIAVHGPKNPVDKTFKGARLHP